MSNVKTVNHGNVFNTGDWYTFNCEECNSSVWKNEDTCSCGVKLIWDK